MPGLLARSKSLRLLRGGRKDVRQEETQPPVPIPQSIKADLDTCKSAAPLPTTAKQPETPIPATRPRTSNGPGDRTPLFHKKTTPVPSIYSQDHIQSLPSLASSTTVLPSAQGREGQGADTGVIGIALGSPTRGSHWNIATPQNSNHNVQSSVKNTDMGVCRAATTPSANGRPEPPKSKLSRWKSLFRRTPRLPTQQEKKSFYQVAPALPTDRADSHHGNESLDHQAPENQKEEIDTLSPPTYKPDIRKSRQAREDPVAHPLPAQPRQRAWTVGANSTDPRRTRVKRASTVPSLSTQSLAQKPTAVSQVAQTAFVKSPLQNVLQDSSTVPHVEIMSSPQILTAGASQEIPQLDINIPEVKLDRYSVMFNNVIEQPQSQTASLLERRQGNVEKLRPLIGLSNKGVDAESPEDCQLKRRATSPALPSPSTKLSLAPPVNTGRSRSPSPSPSLRPTSRNRYRSQTAPANPPLIETPSRSSCEDSHTPEMPAFKPSTSLYMKPQLSALTLSSVRSYESDTESITIMVDGTAGENGKPWNARMDENEPEWEILPRPLMVKPLKVANGEMCHQTDQLPGVQRQESTPVQTPELKQDNEPSAIQTLTRLASQKQPRVTKLSALSSHPSSAPLDIPSPLQNLQSLLSPPLTADCIHDKPQEHVRIGIARSVSMSRRVENKATVGIARSVSVSRARSPRPSLKTAATFDAGSPQRLIQRQTLTPTIVEVGNRKSQRVMLMDA